MDTFNSILDSVSGVLWHDVVLYIVLGTGVLFTLWSGFCQYHALTHGVSVTRGVYDRKGDPGAINHFQALSAALSATVGLGNIGGVALALALGGPGAVFWMWIIGLVGMALKTTEVTLSMLYRDTSDSDNPHGGPMFVVAKGLAERNLAPLGKLIGGIFVVTLLIATATGGNMFQCWNVAEVTYDAFGVPKPLVGIVLAVFVGLVIIGGVKRIGAVAGRLVPVMVGIYFLAGLYVLGRNFGEIPHAFGLIFTHAFSPADASGAFLGASSGVAFSWGLKRALFSSESGQGSSPIAHSAAKTDEPVREGVVAGLEPFIDTLVVCTLTALVVLVSGAWERGPEAPAPGETGFTRIVVAGNNDSTTWSFGSRREDTPEGFAATSELPRKTRDAREVSGAWRKDDGLFIVAHVTDEDGKVTPVKLTGSARVDERGTPDDTDDDTLLADWGTIESAAPPVFADGEGGIHREYIGAALTTQAFNLVTPGLGTWLVLIASWLFAFSTLISWSYYGEQGVVFLVGDRGVLAYKVVFCLLAVVATLDFVSTDKELNNLTNLGTGVMLWANIPIMLVFGVVTMGAYREYFRRLRRGEMRPPHLAPPVADVVEGRDIEND